MTAEMSGKWKPTRETRARVSEIRKGIEQDRKEFENQTSNCPIHDLPSHFDRREGSYTRGYAVFRCPKGHDFKVG